VADRAAVLHAPVAAGAEHLAVDDQRAADRHAAFAASDARLLERDLEELIVHRSHARRYGRR
jgi:hypothetical protein